MVTSTGIMKVFPGRIIEPGYDPGFSSGFKKATKSEKIILTQYKRTNIGTIAKAERFGAGVGIQAKSLLNSFETPWFRDWDLLYKYFLLD